MRESFFFSQREPSRQSFVRLLSLCGFAWALTQDFAYVPRLSRLPQTARTYTGSPTKKWCLFAPPEAYMPPPGSKRSIAAALTLLCSGYYVFQSSTILASLLDRQDRLVTSISRVFQRTEATHSRIDRLLEGVRPSRRHPRSISRNAASSITTEPGRPPGQLDTALASAADATATFDARQASAALPGDARAALADISMRGGKAVERVLVVGAQDTSVAIAIRHAYPVERGGFKIAFRTIPLANAADM